MRLHGSLRPQGLDDYKAGVVKLADTQDLGSCGLVPWGFKSLRPHHSVTAGARAADRGEIAKSDGPTTRLLCDSLKAI